MRYTRTILLAMAAAGLILGTSCNLFKSKTKWTVIAYYDGNNNLDNGQNGSSWVISEAQEAEKVGSTDQVEYVAMVASLKIGGQATYYHLEKNVNELPDSLKSTVLEKLGTKDMSDPTTLTNFIKYAKQKYPAEHYMLMLKDHGGGWHGAMEDEQNGAGGLMSLPAIAQALDTFHFDVISFDACLMGMVEVGYELRHKADYLTASQFITYAGTYGSAEWLGYLVGKPNATPLELAKEVVQATQNADNAKQFTGQMAAIDLSKMDALVSDVAALGNNLVTASGDHGDEVLDAFSKTHSTDLDDPTFVDLREFCKQVLQEPNLKNVNVLVSAANAVIQAINDAVPMTMTNAVGISRGGLCIYFPSTTQAFQADSASYVKCQFQSSNWPAFLSAFIQAVGGGTTGNIHLVSTPAGAEIWLDGNDLGAVTPATVQGVPAGAHAVKLTLANYQDWTNNVQVTAGQTAEVNATLVPAGGGNATISGTVAWPGHSLDQYTFAILDTVNGSYYAYYADVTVNPTNGSFQISVSLPSALPQVLITAVDDVNNDGYINAGDGFGWWDRDGSGGTSPNTGDIFSLSPGQQVTGANITLLDVTDGPTQKLGAGSINRAQ
jgi:hypothetical protein